LANILLGDVEFQVFQRIIYNEIGIDLTRDKKELVQSRLLKKILQYELNSYSEYLRLIQIDNREKVEMLNLITTNETFFFREESHFEYCKKNIFPKSKPNEKFRVWSAASSVGAEAYSMAMFLDSYFNRNSWEVIGTDINTDVVTKARQALYPEAWLSKIPLHFRKLYCLRGKGKFEGQFMIERSLLENVSFEVRNLLNPLRDIGSFNIIFLRNILIYFDDKTRQVVLDNVVDNLKPQGYLIISYTENLNNLNTDKLIQVNGSIYYKR